MPIDLLTRMFMLNWPGPVPKLYGMRVWFHAGSRSNVP